MAIGFHRSTNCCLDAVAAFDASLAAAIVGVLRRGAGAALGRHGPRRERLVGILRVIERLGERADQLIAAVQRGKVQSFAGVAVLLPGRRPPGSASTRHRSGPGRTGSRRRRR